MGRYAVPGIANEREAEDGGEGVNQGDGGAGRETAGGTIGDEPAGIEKMLEAEVPLVQKKRRLVKAGQAESVQERSTIEATGLGGDGAEQATSGPSRGKTLRM